MATSRSSARLPRTTGLFVTGTDTGVGKTTVSCGLLRLLACSGYRPVPFKPVETGCRRGVPADARALRDAALRPDLDLDLVCHLTFSEPIAPAAAAALHGTRIRRSSIRAAYRRLLPLGNYVIVEGAGGLLSPYAPGFTGADLASDLELPVLLVARNALGTINHTALAVAEIRRRRLQLAGYLLVTTAAVPGLARQQNAGLLTDLIGMPPLAVLKHFRHPTPDQVARELARSLPTNFL
jgi:dethiobiotin synthetase